MLTSTKSSSI